MAVQGDVMEAAAGPYDRARALGAFKLGDVTFYWITRACAISVLLILGGIILSLIAGAWPAIKAYGLSFLITSRWAPSADPPVLGALGPIYGTLVTSVIAMVIAIPVGLGIAIFLTDLCPLWLRRPIGIAVELLAGIPSIIYGMWGFFVLGPFLAYTFQPFMISLFGNIPVLNAVFAGPPSYLSLFNAALILAIMVLPFITAISVDVFKTVPPVLKEAAYGVGCTTWEVVRNGIAGFSLDVFTKNTPPPGSTDGGLLNAIVGSVIMTVIGVGIGAPLGLFAGTYLAEYGRHDRLTSVIRFINDILLSAPSIIIGLFIYGAVVVPMRGFSAIAGCLALAVIVIPVVLRTTEDMLALVPNPLREAASALGLPRSLVIKRIAYRAARSGLITGVLLATARVAGETAPLLFTALSNQFFSLNLTKTMANLPVTINNFVQSPYVYWKQLAWSGALLITLTVLALNIGARILGAERTAK